MIEHHPIGTKSVDKNGKKMESVVNNEHVITAA